METAILTTDNTASESTSSAVSWAPVIAGSVVAATASLCLLILGSGLGLTVISPWSSNGVDAATLAVSAIIWLIVVQWVSAGLGGYLTGRLRTKWVGVHTDEVFFRDTAHGFLAWALSTLVVAWLVGGTLAGMVNSTTQAIATVGSGAAMGAATQADDVAGNANGYYIDLLFRLGTTNTPTASDTSGEDIATARSEAGRILFSGAVTGEMSADDKAYLAQVVSRQTGLPQAEAQTRVDDVLSRIEAAKVQAQQKADEARKAGITLSLMMFASLLIGAFIASVAAAYGGRQRDDYEPQIVGGAVHR